MRRKIPTYIIMTYDPPELSEEEKRKRKDRLDKLFIFDPKPVTKEDLEYPK